MTNSCKHTEVTTLKKDKGCSLSLRSHTGYWYHVHSLYWDLKTKQGIICKLCVLAGGSLWQEQREPAGGPSPEPMSSTLPQPFLGSIVSRTTCAWRLGQELSWGRRGGLCPFSVSADDAQGRKQVSLWRAKADCSACTRASMHNKGQVIACHTRWRVVEQGAVEAVSTERVWGQNGLVYCCGLSAWHRHSKHLQH